MYRMENEYLPTGLSAFATAPNPPLSDLTQYINPHVKNNRVQNAIGNHIQGFRKPSKPDTYKTVMCQAWLESMSCSFKESCKFAHGESELRPAKTQIRNHLKYKTKLCEKYTSGGICPYGSRCLFIHPATISNQMKPETTLASMIGSENSSPVSITTSLDLPLSPTANPLQSIWASNPNIMNFQQPRQMNFNKAGCHQARMPIRGAVVGSPLHATSAGDIIDSSMLFNQTAEAMVSFLWA